MNYISNIYSEKISKLKGKKELLQDRLDRLTNQINRFNIDVKSLEKAQAFIQLVAKETQEQIRFAIEDVVNLALDSVFPDEYIFNVNFEIKRGKTEAALNFTKGGIEIDPMEASGG
ncbi:MAG: hypothetical protein WC554_13220, partial [Clostridia bacterium]